MKISLTSNQNSTSEVLNLHMHVSKSRYIHHGLQNSKYYSPLATQNPTTLVGAPPPRSTNQIPFLEISSRNPSRNPFSQPICTKIQKPKMPPPRDKQNPPRCTILPRERARLLHHVLRAAGQSGGSGGGVHHPRRRALAVEGPLLLRAKFPPRACSCSTARAFKSRPLVIRRASRSRAPCLSLVSSKLHYPVERKREERASRKARTMYSLYRAWFGGAEEPSYPRLDTLAPPDTLVRVGNDGEYHFVAHRAVLSAHSGYLKALLAGAGAEAASAAGQVASEGQQQQQQPVITSVTVPSTIGE